MSFLTSNWLTACVLIHNDCLYDITLTHQGVVDFASPPLGRPSTSPSLQLFPSKSEFNP